ncbi:MAG: histidine ammonia-lyase [Woeseiaceae bacterium]|nr:histidine ammonia-lyase [Woeseiaceae bacterium]
MNLMIDNQLVTLDVLRTAWEGPLTVSLGADAKRRIAEAQELIDDVVASGKQVYGVNTGFGQMAQVRISNDELAHLQANLVRSHAVGVGEDLDDNIVRLIMLMKVIALAEGFSGVRVELVEMLCEMINHNIYPRIPSRGSVGASGDLAPLAHMAGALIGDGEVRVDGHVLLAVDALKAAGLEPAQLAPKEGLALLNGTQVSTGLALAAAFRTENLLAAVMMAGAMSSDAIRGSDTPFDKRIQNVRGHGGQIAVAGVLREFMHGSDIRASHEECERVQDPYSIRCQPQVVGACLDVLRHVSSVLETEANAVTDNPLVFTDSKSVLSGGNFHAEPIALAADYLALAIAEIGALSERRIALLIDSHMSGLPAFLVKDGGLNSGFMMAQVTAAALASENKSYAHPASVDSIPTSANQEDHVSMATFAARRLHTMIDNVANIIAIELLAAAQGIEFHRPKTSSSIIEEVIAELRKISPAYETDRSLSADIQRVASVVDNGTYCRYAASVLPSYCT